MTIKINKQIADYIKKTFQGYVFTMGITSGKNSRKKVLHSKTSKIMVSRGIANQKSQKGSKTKNEEVMEYLYKRGFTFFANSFTNSNPNYNTFIKSISYILDTKEIRKLENAITANVKAYLDQQVTFTNKASTAKSKGFNKFGLDSRQLQLALDTTSEKKKASS